MNDTVRGYANGAGPAIVKAILKPAYELNATPAETLQLLESVIANVLVDLFPAATDDTARRLLMQGVKARVLDIRAKMQEECAGTVADVPFGVGKSQVPPVLAATLEARTS